jgi:hypothetical protein
MPFFIGSSGFCSSMHVVLLPAGFQSHAGARLSVQHPSNLTAALWPLSDIDERRAVAVPLASDNVNPRRDLIKALTFASETFAKHSSNTQILLHPVAICQPPPPRSEIVARLCPYGLSHWARQANDRVFCASATDRITPSDVLSFIPCFCFRIAARIVPSISLLVILSRDTSS